MNDDLLTELTGKKIESAEFGEGGMHLKLDSGYTLILSGSFVVGLCLVEPTVH